MSMRFRAEFKLLPEGVTPALQRRRIFQEARFQATWNATVGSSKDLTVTLQPYCSNLFRIRVRQLGY